MSKPKNLGFGGLLIGIGAGWLLFQNYELTSETFSYAIILFGLSIVASNLLKYFSPKTNIGGLVSGVTFGLIIALLITNGFNIFTGIDLFNRYDHKVNDPRSFNGAMTSNKVLFSTINVNGDISVSTWSENTYEILVTVIGKGNSDEDAMNILSEAITTLDDSISLGTQELVLTLNIPTNKWNRFEVDIEVSLPKGITLDLDTKTTNGNIRVEDILCKDIETTTTNGDIRFININASSISCSLTNGNIDGKFDSSDMSGHTTNGNINIDLYSVASGKYDLSTTNGNVDVDLKESADIGIKLEGTVSNGIVSFGVNDVTYYINTSKHKTAQSENYESSLIQIDIYARITNGNIDIT